MTHDVLPGEPLSPLATLAERVLARYDYEVAPAIGAIDDAVPGFGGLFDPGTTSNELTDALDRLLEADDVHRRRPRPLRGGRVTLYVDGSSRGNPGPAGAGAVIVEGEKTLTRLGRPVGSNAGNNTAEFAALHLGLHGLLERYEPTNLEVRIDSMTVVREVWQGRATENEGFEPYRRSIGELLAEFPHHGWTHLADSDPNPADALATVGADIADLGP